MEHVSNDHGEGRNDESAKEAYFFFLSFFLFFFSFYTVVHGDVMPDVATDSTT